MTDGQAISPIRNNQKSIDGSSFPLATAQAQAANSTATTTTTPSSQDVQPLGIPTRHRHTADQRDVEAHRAYSANCSICPSSRRNTNRFCRPEHLRSSIQSAVVLSPNRIVVEAKELRSSEHNHHQPHTNKGNRLEFELPGHELYEILP